MDQNRSLRALCGWSIGCYVGTYAPYFMILTYLAAIKFNLDRANPLVVLILLIVSCISAWGIRVTAWTLMIIARARDTKYKFALVLMWVYIGILIFNIISYFVSTFLSMTLGAFAYPIFLKFIEAFRG